MAIALVQGGSSGMVQNASASPMAPSLTGVTAGHTLILATYIAGAGGAQPSVSAVTQAGVVWVQLFEYDWTAEGVALDLWWCASATAGTNTPSVAFSSSGGITADACAAYLSEWSGIGSSQIANSAVGTTTTITGPSLTPSAAGELYFMIAGQFTSTTCAVSASSSPTSGWTNVTAGLGGGGPQIFTSGDNDVPIGYQVLTGTSAAQLEYTITGGGTNWAAVAALFQPSAGAHWAPPLPGWGATL